MQEQCKRTGLWIKCKVRGSTGC